MSRVCPVSAAILSAYSVRMTISNQRLRRLSEKETKKIRRRLTDMHSTCDFLHALIELQADQEKENHHEPKSHSIGCHRGGTRVSGHLGFQGKSRCCLAGGPRSRREHRLLTRHP